MSESIQSLKYSRGSLLILDQLRLPEELVYVEVNDIQETWSVIRTMQVRGAPLIAIVGMLGLAVAAEKKKKEELSLEKESVAQFLLDGLAYLRTSRPTAVNLFTAADKMEALVREQLSNPSINAVDLLDSIILAAEEMQDDDLKTNRAIGDNGARRIVELVKRDKIRVLTICNTGSLATAGYGTALGVVRSLHALGKLEHVYACETRPYNQGARLTAFEIVQDRLPGTLITDSMASYLMATKGVDVVVVGADRVAANGDTANKIGTYQLAVTAKYHGVPFFTALPVTTMDLSMASGAEIHVEERPGHELTSIFGRQIAPTGIAVWNPSFDVTPSTLIQGIISEVGVAESATKGGIIDLPQYLRSHGLEEKCARAVVPVDSTIGFKRMTEADIADYVVNLGGVLGALLGTANSADLTVKEVGDGNLNFVYIITSAVTGKSVVAKQALPYVRCVGESWPLTLDRAIFETNALVAERALANETVPEVYYFDRKLFLIVMEFVAPPNIILRKHFINGTRVAGFAEHLASFVAKTLFGSSGLALSGTELRTRVASWSKNTAMCALTEQVIFTDPYMEAKFNRWTTPQLDGFAASIRNDTVLKISASRLKALFVGSTQALLHGDLHSGSVMSSDGTTFVIDPEFAFYGPMGFDIGALLSNFLMAYFSQAGYEGRADYADYLLNQIAVFHRLFETKFIELWNESNASGTIGELYPSTLFSGSSLALAQKQFLREVWLDTLGFTGMKMIRRIVGIAHVADLESIADADVRSRCEKKSLLLARELVLLSNPYIPHSARDQCIGIDWVLDKARLVNALVDNELTWPQL